MLFTMFINLYTTRLVLENLGVEDYGVYGVVGGIVGLFSVFKDGITGAVQRFISFELGKKTSDVNKVFCTSLNLLLILALLLFPLMEFLGVYMLNASVNIPIQRMHAASFILHFIILTSLIDLISVPYNALIIAHERLDSYAVISIIQAVLTCVAAFLLSLWADNLRLQAYALLMFIISFIIRLIYQIYCSKKFDEAKYHSLIDNGVVKEMGRYTGITTISGILQVLVSQGIVLVINNLYGVVINAVYMLGRQLTMSFMSFGTNIYRAISPQIIKTYASEEFDIHKRIVYMGCKIDVYMILFILVPFIVKTEYILSVWLKDVPDHMVIFARWSVLISLLYAFLNPITGSVRASGKISSYMIIPELLFALVIPFGYLLFLVNKNPDFFMALIVVLQFVMVCVKLYFACNSSFLKFGELVSIVVAPCLFVFILSLFSCICIQQLLNDSFVGLCLLLIFNSLSLIIVIYIGGLSNYEKSFVYSTFRKILK